MKSTKTSVITLTLLLSLTLLPFAQAGAFSDWWNNLFTGNVIEETTKTSDSQTADADVELAKTIEEQDYQEPTPILEPIGTPIDTKQKTIKTTDLINTFKQGITGTQKNEFLQAIKQQTNTQRELGQQTVPTTNNEPTIQEQNTQTGKEFTNTFKQGIQNSELENTLLASQRQEPLSNQEETTDTNTEEPTINGFFGWLRNLLGIGNEEEDGPSTQGSGTGNDEEICTRHSNTAEFINQGAGVSKGPGRTYEEAIANLKVSCETIKKGITARLDPEEATNQKAICENYYKCKFSKSEVKLENIENCAEVDYCVDETDKYRCVVDIVDGKPQLPGTCTGGGGSTDPKYHSIHCYGKKPNIIKASQEYTCSYLPQGRPLG